MTPDHDSAPARRGKRIAWRIALASASLVLTLAVLEFAATRILGASFVRGAHVGNSWMVAGRLDPELGWSGRPKARGRVRSGAMDYTIALNSRGFRDRERALEKPAGTRRVAVLGDSVAWGWGVEQDERFSDLLEARLGPAVEVLNFACPGYGTDQHYWTLVDAALAYQPDLVLLCFILNDVNEAQSEEVYEMRKPRFVQRDAGEWSIAGRPVVARDPHWLRTARGLWRAALARSAFLSWIRARPSGTAEEPAEEEPTRRRYRPPKAETLALVHGYADLLADRESAPRHAFELLAGVCRERGVPLLVTHIAHKHDQYLYEPLYPLPEDLGPRPFATYTSGRLAELCGELAVPFVPLDHLFLAVCRAGERLHVGDGHPNARGHRIVADALAEPLAELLLGR